MINLYETDQRVRDDNRPEHSAENTVNNETYTADHVDNSDLSYILQYETQYNKKRCGISYIGSSFGIHEKSLQGHKLNHFQ
jgi:hypothetical protein